MNCRNIKDSVNQRNLLLILGVFSMSVLLLMVTCIYLELLQVKIKKGNIHKYSLEELVKYSARNRFPNGVPKIVHYTSKERVIPKQYLSLIADCVKLNPDVLFAYWSDSSIYELIEGYFPSHLGMYMSYLQPKSHILKKSDISRYFILEHFGGIYMDLDTRCQKPMEVAMVNVSCTISREPEVQTRILYNIDYNAMNSYMACVPNHEFFDYLVKALTKDDTSNILWKTGPIFMTNILLQYNKSLSISDLPIPQKYINVASSDLFSPLGDITVNFEGHCRSTNPNQYWKTKGCKDLAEYRKNVNQKTANAVVVHLFMHLGYAENKDRINELIDIRDLKKQNLKIIF